MNLPTRTLLLTAGLLFLLHPNLIQGQIQPEYLPLENSTEYREMLGHILSQQDWAAEVGTDALIRLGADLKNTHLKGFIVENLEHSWVLSYISKRNFSHGVLYQIEINADGPIDDTYKQFKKARKLTKQQKVLFKATQLASKQEYLKCSHAYNNVAHFLTLGKETYIYVYLLAATNQPNINIMGGHHRFIINEKGTQVVQHSPHTVGCLNSETNREATSLAVTHMTSGVPNEFHIYMSYLYDMPVFVWTSDGEALWQVYEGKIRTVDISDQEQQDKPTVQPPKVHNNGPSEGGQH